MIRIALLMTGLSLAACTPSTEPAAELDTTATATSVEPMPDPRMPPSDAAAGAGNPSVPATAMSPAETHTTPADAVEAPKRAADRTTGISAPAPPPIEDPAPVPLPTQ